MLLLQLVAILPLLLTTTTYAFVQPLTSPAPTGDLCRDTTHLDAVKRKSSSSSSGGFGPATVSESSGKSRSRTVPGHAGSGTTVLSNAANDFDRIRKLYGKDATCDVYVQSPLNDESVFWFVGKVIRIIENTGDDEGSSSTSSTLAGTVYPTITESILSQKRLILEYAKSELRPQNLGGKYANDLELWHAPGDSEMDVVRNKIVLERVIGSTRDIRDGFDVNDVGYNPEIYVGEEKEKGGLRVVRDADGRPVKPVFDITV